MGLFFRSAKQKCIEAQLQQDSCEQYLAGIRSAMAELMELFTDETRYIDPDAGSRWKAAHRELLSDGTLNAVLRLKKADGYSQLTREYYELTQCARVLDREIALHNDSLANRETNAAAALIGSVEGHPLDAQQLGCIVRDVHSHLVLAGAGTGKTTTILGKIKYLLASGKCQPSDLLVLSFTNASASEMRERIQTETGVRIAASTFHKLGLNIIRSVEGSAPRITQLNLKRFVRDRLELEMKKPDYLRLLTAYLTYYRVPVRSEFSFRTMDEYREYLELYPPKTVRQETVKTYGEMDIANFLTQNGIAYRYDYPYPLTGDYESYRPSFYLPDHKIYIQYRSLNRDGRAPAYFPTDRGRPPTQTLLDQRNRELEIHRAHGTTLVECFACESMDGSLFGNLKSSLEALGIPCKPLSPKRLWTKLCDGGAGSLDAVAELMETVINLLKSNAATVPQVRARNTADSYSAATELVLALVTPVYDAYCENLSRAGELDFNDMINRARRYVEEQRWKSPYKYVVVDEYQDISASRFALLKALRESRDYKLFCVGDDWQSIYRFAGSDVGLILNFEQSWGASQISRIETTYRFPQQLIEITGSFVMRNPAQLRKNIRGVSEESEFPLEELSGYTEKAALEAMLPALQKLPKDSTVFLIGRYGFDGTPLGELPGMKTAYDAGTGFTEVRLDGREDLHIRFLTAHRSKGLQADYVFILNNRRSRLGFPSKVQEAPIMGLLLDSWDRFPDAEERRLYYVAMTRARKKVYFLTVQGEESDFALELRQAYGDRMKKPPKKRKKSPEA